MPFVPTAQSVMESLTSLDLYRIPSGVVGDTVTTDAITEGDIDAAVASIVNFAANDPVFIQGSGGTELNAVAVAAGLLLTFGRKAKLPQDIGARIVEAARYPLGHIAEDSVSFGGSSTVNAVPAATSRTPIAYISVGGELSFSFGLLGIDSRTLAVAFAQAEKEIGVGTAADPYQISLDQSSIGSVGLQVFRARGLRKDGSIVEVDFNDAVVAVSGEVNVSGKSARPFTVSGRATSHIVRIWK